MPKPNPHGGFNTRTQSAANPRIYRGAPPKPVKDRRDKTVRGGGQQGSGTCAHCGVLLTLRKVTPNAPSRYGDLPVGSVVIVKHTPGGGTYSLRRNDTLCPGAEMRPAKTKGALE